jgi:thiol-disulfide isomerase/thioredoxin
MTDLAAASPSAEPPTAGATGAAVPRKPRKVFLLVGLVVAAVLGIGLFTSIGTNKKNGPPHQGGQMPSFSAPRLNGSGTVQVPADGGGGGTPAVLLFFGEWCTVCKAELPPLATAIRHQSASGGALSKVHIIGVDSDHVRTTGLSFIKSRGIGFPVAFDPDIAITNGAFYFQGDPFAVFVKGDGVISAIVPGPLSAAKFTAEEQKLIPSES